MTVDRLKLSFIKNVNNFERYVFKTTTYLKNQKIRKNTPPKKREKINLKQHKMTNETPTSLNRNKNLIAKIKSLGWKKIQCYMVLRLSTHAKVRDSNFVLHLLSLTRTYTTT